MRPAQFTVNSLALTPVFINPASILSISMGTAVPTVFVVENSQYAVTGTLADAITEWTAALNYTPPVPPATTTTP